MPNGSVIDLHGAWRFRHDAEDVGCAQGWQRNAVDAAWESVEIPQAWDAYEWDDRRGPAWFARRFSASWNFGESVAVFIHGVDASARVWLNGEALHANQSHGLRRGFDASASIRRGASVLCIRVARHGGPGGILRSVRVAAPRDDAAFLAGECHGRSPRPSADWVRDAVIYQVYLRSFSNQGTIAGLIERLDELKELGATLLWLMPIHPVGRERRKGSLGSPYAVRDYYGVNSEFGSLDDLRVLIDQVHSRGMRIILDVVLNHTAWDCPLVREHPDWFKHNAAGEIVPPNPGWTDVAALDYAKRDVRRYMEDVLAYWAGDVGVDGFRCDVAGLIPLDFWEAARTRLDAIKSILMLAEDDAPAGHLTAFDLTYDWQTYALLERFAAGCVRPAWIADMLLDETLEFPAASLRMRFTSNHDKCAWIQPALVRYGPAGAKAAAVLSFALPGVPLIYNGQEVGNTTPLPLFERVAIDWTRDEHDMHGLYKRLASLRSTHEAFRRGKVRVFDTRGAPSLLALERSAPIQRAIVLINFSCDALELESSLPALVGVSPRIASDGARVDARRVRLPGFGFWIGVS